MKSTEKVLTLLEEAQEAEDGQLEEAVPLGLPPFLLRGALLTLGETLPSDPDELDAFLADAAGFFLNLRSDDAPALPAA